MLSLSLDDLIEMKEYFPMYLSELMRGSRTLLAKKLLKQVLFMDHLAKLKRDDPVKEKSTSSSTKGTVALKLTEGFLALLLKTMEQ